MKIRQRKNYYYYYYQNVFHFVFKENAGRVIENKIERERGRMSVKQTRETFFLFGKFKKGKKITRA